MKRAWAKPFQTSRTRAIHHDYDTIDQWSKAHQEFQENPVPKKGNSYVAHASAIIPLLETFSELHPVAGVVIKAFKTAVTYEQMREENDARVAIVFLAQADLMSFFLTTKQLSNQLRQQIDQNDIRIDDQLKETLRAIKVGIETCGNSMDVYYAEKRLVKYFKAREWKDRIEEHMTMFDKLRNRLSQILTVRIAADTNNLVDEMRTLNASVGGLLSRLFLPRAGWERDVDQKRLELVKESGKDPKEMLNDAQALQILADLTQDPSLDSKHTQENLRGSKAVNSVKALPTEIDVLKKDLNSPLDILCKRNEETFKLKLDFHTEQLQNAIHDSAQYVVQSLTGPHDRLRNEDLKILWKEMNWIFCVDNKNFTNALFEYYLDHFSSLKEPSASAIKDGSEDRLQKIEEHRDVDENLTKVTFLSRMGVLNHVNAWTLEPMAIYGDRIASSVDRDESGYIRISEVNSFTDRMPKGWTLPQWCAYAAIGWTYEARIYRKRMNHILGKMFEMHAKVLPANRLCALIVNQNHMPFFYLLAWEPWDTASAGREKHPSPIADLCNLVHEKMKQQDNILRDKLQKLNWSVEDETMLNILCGKEPLETYALQICTIILERVYEVMQACTKVTIDKEELDHLTMPLALLQNVCTSHVTSLKAQWKREKKRDDYISSFHGGIWNCIDQVNETNFSLPFKKEDVEDFALDDEVLDKFYPPKLVDGKLPYLKYPPWEEFIKSLTPEKVPEEVPDTWLNYVEGPDMGSYRIYMAQFPFVMRSCDVCHRYLEQECYYACTVCYDFDMCSKCYMCSKDMNVPGGHQFSHSVLRFALPMQNIPRQWILLESQVQTKHIQEDILVLLGLEEMAVEDQRGIETASDADQSSNDVVCEERGQMSPVSLKDENDTGTDLDRVTLADDGIHDKLGEKEHLSQPKDMNIADLNANMNGENTMESEADGGERDGYAASNNIDRHSEAEQSVQGKASEVVGEMGDVFSLSTGIDEKIVDETVVDEEARDNLASLRGCDINVGDPAGGGAHEEAGEREGISLIENRVLLRSGSPQSTESKSLEEVEERAVYPTPNDIATEDLAGHDTCEEVPHEREDEVQSENSRSGPVAAHLSGDEPHEAAEKRVDDSKPDAPVVEVMLKKYKSCNHCKGNITLDNITTFYKCFRHSCSDYWLCESCVDKQMVDEDPDGHQWWHSLIVLRYQIIFAGVDTPDLRRSESHENDTKNSISNSSGGDDLGNRISAVVVEKLDATHLMVQNTLSSFVDSQTKSSSVQGDDSVIYHRLGDFEGRMEDRISRLEDKVDMMIGEMRAFFSTLAPSPRAEN